MFDLPTEEFPINNSLRLDGYGLSVDADMVTVLVEVDLIGSSCGLEDVRSYRIERTLCTG